jgi:hypothetical protein
MHECVGQQGVKSRGCVREATPLWLPGFVVREPGTLVMASCSEHGSMQSVDVCTSSRGCLFSDGF